MKGLLFADNPLLHSPSVEAMSESLNILNKYSLTRPPLPINQDKSKIMIFQKRHTILNSVYRITTGEQKLEQLTLLDYIYLIIIITFFPVLLLLLLLLLKCLGNVVLYSHSNKDNGISLKCREREMQRERYTEERESKKCR